MATRIEKLYISLIGHQFMATLNPLLVLLRMDGRSLREERNDILVVLLATTGKSADFARRMETLLSNICRVRVQLVSISLVTDNPDLCPVQDAVVNWVEKYAQAEIFFNLAGGLGFHIPACALALSGYDAIKYLYPEFSAVRLYARKGAGSNALRLMEVLSIPSFPLAYLFESQGLEFRKAESGKLHPVLRRWLNDFDLQLPRSAQPNLIVSGICFDVVFNSANTLCLLKVMTAEKGNQTQDIREIIAAVATRKSLGDLFHYKILILTDSKFVAERFRTESSGKIEVVRYGNPYALKKLKPRLQSFFSPPAVKDKPEKPLSRPPLAGDCGNGDVLYTFIGRSAMPTLKAIWSHKAARTCLLYTEEDQRVRFFKENFQRYSKIIPSRLEFVPISFHARELEDFVPPENESFVVNITPGTKLQAFFLARMAWRCNREVFSLDRDTLSLIYGRSSDAEKKICSPELEDYIKLTIDSSKISYAADFRNVTDENSLEVLFKLFRNMRNCITCFYGKSKPGKLYGDTFFKRTKERFTVKWNGKTYRFNTNPNTWFEHFVSYGVCRMIDGAKVLLSLQTSWNQADNVATFRSESDVCVKVENRYYLISCKSGRFILGKDEQRRAALEIKATSVALGRMVIPLLAVLGFDGDFPEVVEGVYMFGHKTLTEKEALKKLFADADRAASTISRPR